MNYISELQVPQNDIKTMCQIAETIKHNVLVSQKHITINAKSLLAYSILDFDKSVKLIVRGIKNQDELEEVREKFKKWIKEK